MEDNDIQFIEFECNPEYIISSPLLAQELIRLILWLCLQLSENKEVECVWHWSDREPRVLIDANDKLLLDHLKLIE